MPNPKPPTSTLQVMHTLGTFCTRCAILHTLLYYRIQNHTLSSTKKADENRTMIGYEHTGVRNIIQGVLLGHLLHTISYTIQPLPTGPPQKRKLPDGEFCTG